jgi:hypothetical protein
MIRRTLVLAVVLLGAPRAVRAHPFAPALLQFEEASPDQIDVSWKQPAVRVQGSRLRPVLPPACAGVGDPVVRQEGTGLRATWRIRCPDGLAGQTVGVEGIASSKADVLLRVTLRDGRRLRQVLTAAAPSFEIRAGSGRTGVFRDYARLGVQHILTGWDHLLFVLGLVLLVGWGSSLLWTVTAFTLGHSVTLALASLGLVHVPQAPIEAAIALSIYVLAVELARSRAATAPSPSAPRGWSPAASACSTAWASPGRSPRSACHRPRSRWRCSRSTPGSSSASSPSSPSSSRPAPRSAGSRSPGRAGPPPPRPTRSASWRSTGCSSASLSAYRSSSPPSSTPISRRERSRCRNSV